MLWCPIHIAGANIPDMQRFRGSATSFTQLNCHYQLIIMWNEFKKLPQTLVGQSIFSFLELKSIVRLETALVRSEPTQTLLSFLSFYSKEDIIVNIPDDIIKLKWLQAHDFPITSAIVHLDKIKSTFDTKMIKEIDLVDNERTISMIATNLLPYNCYEKVVSFGFYHEQDTKLMEKLFSFLHNLREVRITFILADWILNILRGLYNRLGNNVMIEKVIINRFDRNECSVAELAKYCPRLTSLSTGFPIGEDSLLVLSRHCPLLKELKVRGIPSISTEETAALCAPALSCIRSIATSCIKLLNTIDTVRYAMTVPYLTGVQALALNDTIDYELLPLISQYCLKLESISISGSSTATPEQLLHLAQNCRHLRIVDLTKHDLCNDEIVTGLAQHCPNLQSLLLQSFFSYRNITDVSLLALSEHCPQLRELDFHQYILLTEAAALQLIHSCKHIHVLMLPINCISEETVLSLPVKASKSGNVLILTFNT